MATISLTRYLNDLQTNFQWVYHFPTEKEMIKLIQIEIETLKRKILSYLLKM